MTNYGPPPGYPPSGFRPPPPPQKQSNGVAIGGFILAILAFVFALAGVTAFAVILGLIAGVLAIMGLVQAAAANGSGRALSVFGVGIAVIALIVGVAHTTSAQSGYTAGYAGSTATPPTVTYSLPTETAPALPAGTFEAGTYEVGTDIQPGTYRTAGSSFCYWERERGNSGEFSDIIANDNVTGQGSMMIKSTDKFVKFDGTCVWTKR